MIFHNPGDVSELDKVLPHRKKSSKKDADSNQQVLDDENRNIFGEKKNGEAHCHGRRLWSCR